VLAHKVVVSACSTALRPMLAKSDNARPLIYLVGVKINDLCALLNFMYRGETCVYKVRRRPVWRGSTPGPFSL
jgi:hypothetical protein